MPFHALCICIFSEKSPLSTASTHIDAKLKEIDIEYGTSSKLHVQVNDLAMTA